MGNTDTMHIQRNTWNLVMFMISYFISNLVSGVIYDSYVHYMQETARSVTTSFWAFYGYATFLSALLLLLVPRTGYCRLLLCSVGRLCPAAGGPAEV